MKAVRREAFDSHNFGIEINGCQNEVSIVRVFLISSRIADGAFSLNLESVINKRMQEKS